MALGGVTAALAVVIMCLGGLVPIATFVLPLICCILLQIIWKKLGTKGAWLWYSSVSILSLFFGPDKEAAAVFCMLGCYPIFRPKFPGGFPGTLFKLVYFNVACFLGYSLLIYVFGVSSVALEYKEVGVIMCIIMLLLGNITFLMLDRSLQMIELRVNRCIHKSNGMCIFFNAMMALCILGSRMILSDGLSNIMQVLLQNAPGHEDRSR